MEIEGFKQISSEDIPELNYSEKTAKAYQMQHTKSGARLLYIANDDPEKAFSIGFKTPPTCSNGVFHILEHSVLCGSKHYPTKEPFTNLLKTSMKTFLNAMTFADKTIYPVASTNMKDFYNLVDVYMDAVLFPNIYKNPLIFAQEGGHKTIVNGADGVAGADGLGDANIGSHCDDKDEANNSSAQSEALSDEKDEADNSGAQTGFNGVVYNEMKGAYSDPSSLLYETTNQKLFPDTTYGVDSGGEPNSIKTLTYEQFLTEHKKHYNLDNSYIIVYGDVDIKDFCKHISEKFLNNQDELDKWYAQGECSDNLSPNKIEIQSPVTCDYHKITMNTSPQNASVMCGFVTKKDCLKNMAASILIYALTSTNESPIKKRILKEKFCDDMQVFFYNGIIQPTAYVTFRGIKPDCAKLARETFLKELQNICNKGIDKKLLNASICRMEFILKEATADCSTGIDAAIASLSEWLYDDSKPTKGLKYLDAIKELYKKVDTNYFEDIAKELFLNNNHNATVELVPDDKKEQVFDKPAKAESDQEVQLIKKQEEELRKYQAQPDSEEDLKKLPMLSRKDLNKKGNINIASQTHQDGFKILEHNMKKQGIAYINRFYNANCLKFEDLKYLQILSLLLRKLDTKNYKAADLDLEIKQNIGALSVSATCVSTLFKDDDVNVYCKVNGSSLSQNVDKLAQLTDEIIFHTKFDNKNKIKNILDQSKLNLQEYIINCGHIAAANRANSYYLPEAACTEQYSGVEFYKFLDSVTNNFDKEYDNLVDNVQRVAQQIFCQKPLLSICADRKAQDKYISCMSTEKYTNDQPENNLKPKCIQTTNEGFIIPSNVSYTVVSNRASRCSLLETFKQNNASAMLASTIVSLEYLWNKVRVMGGAYGAGSNISIGGSIKYYSYRDPNFASTVKAFKESGKWLRKQNITDKQIDGFVISAVAALDKPKTPKENMSISESNYFVKNTKEYIESTRTKLLNTTKQDINAAAELIDKLNEDTYVCCFGSSDILKNSGLDVKKLF